MHACHHILYTCCEVDIGANREIMSVVVEICKPVEASAIRMPVIREEEDYGLSGESFLEASVDLNKEVAHDPAATFYARVVGSSTESGFSEGDILVVDRNAPLQHDKLAVCCINNSFTVKRLQLKDGTLWLEALDTPFRPIALTDENQLDVWGLVTYVVKRTW